MPERPREPSRRPRASPPPFEDWREQVLEIQGRELGAISPHEHPRIRDALPSLFKAQNEVFRRYWDDPNIASSSIGFRVKHGRTLQTPVLVISVVRKLPPAMLPKDLLFPERITVGRGVAVEVDVQESGHIYAASYYLKYRPAQGGVGGAHPLNLGGTLGGLVNDTREGGLGIISNNHVFSPSGTYNNGERGNPILQPNPQNGGLQASDRIGTYRRCVTVDMDGVNEVDAAVAGLDRTWEFNNDIMGAMTAPTASQPAVGLAFGFGSIGVAYHCKWDRVRDLLGVEVVNGSGATRGVGVGDPVQKTGCTSEYTAGLVRHNFAGPKINGMVQFYNCIETTDMVRNGDSGSLLCYGHSGGSPSGGLPSAGPGGGGGIGGACGTLPVAADLTELPLTQDQPALEEARDKYLRTTRIGTYAVDLFYQNELYIRDRMESAALDDSAKGLARALYGRYHGDAKLALADPDRDDLRLTDQHFHDAAVALRAARPYLRDDEYRAAEQLLDIAHVALGKNARECLELLDDVELYARVRTILSTVTTIDTVVEDERSTPPGTLLPPPPDGA